MKTTNIQADFKISQETPNFLNICINYNFFCYCNHIINKYKLNEINYIEFIILTKNDLYNKKNKADLKKKLELENFLRETYSFYKYVPLENLQALRDKIYLDWDSLGVLGRVYIAKEGINAQISIPKYNVKKFKTNLYSHNTFNKINIKKAVQPGISFYKLIIKVKEEIVAYKISDNEYDMNKVGKHLNYKEFNRAIEDGATIVDVRNYYEGEVGKFEDAIIPDVDASIELLPEIKKLLKNKKNDKILMYCTGGIRCEKASSYLIHHGFKDVNQLDGGIVQYANDIKKHDEKSKFIGKNFVFDQRLGERITDDIISTCHQCNAKADEHTNCINQSCHILFIQCDKCSKKYSGCCSSKCAEFIKKTKEEQKEIFLSGKIKFTAQESASIKPKLNKIKK